MVLNPGEQDDTQGVTERDAGRLIPNYLHLALGQLDDDERDLILWRHFEQLSARDMAQLLGISEAAASKRYIRAVERLRKILVGLGVTKPGS